MEKERIDATINKEILNDFRRRFILKKGDMSKEIEKFMKNKLKRNKNEGI